MLPIAPLPGETDCDNDASDAACKAWLATPPSGHELLPGSGVVEALAGCAVLLAVLFWLEFLLTLSKKYERKLSVSGALSPTPLLRLNSPKASPALCQVASAGVMYAPVGTMIVSGFFRFMVLTAAVVTLLRPLCSSLIVSWCLTSS